MSEELSFLVANFVFVFGHVENQHRLLFMAHIHEALQQDIPSAQILIFENGNWADGGRYRWAGIGLTTLNDSPGGLIAVGRDGEVVVRSSSGSEEERISDPQKSIGPIRGVSRIDTNVFAYGMRRQVYLRRGKNHWVAWDQGFPRLDRSAFLDPAARIRAITRGMGSINALDGQTIDDLYGIGIRGEIWHNDGSQWNAIDSPTNLNLYDLTVTPQGEVYVCGQGGTLIHGRGDTWEQIEYEGAGDLDFSSVAWYQDKIYLADGQSLMTLDDGVISIVDFGTEEVVPCHQIHVNDGMLLSVAGKEIYTTTDGINWIPIL